MRPQAAGMSCYSVAKEITSVRGDFLVERRVVGETERLRGASSSMASPRV
jgi:hypothetical protein